MSIDNFYTLKEVDDLMLISLLQQGRITLRDIYRIKRDNIDWMTILEENGEFTFEWIEENGK